MVSEVEIAVLAAIADVEQATVPVLAMRQLHVEAYATVNHSPGRSSALAHSRSGLSRTPASRSRWATRAMPHNESGRARPWEMHVWATTTCAAMTLAANTIAAPYPTRTFNGDLSRCPASIAVPLPLNLTLRVLAVVSGFSRLRQHRLIRGWLTRGVQARPEPWEDAAFEAESWRRSDRRPE